MLTVKVESTLGIDILEAVVEMKAFAAKLNVRAIQTFNGIQVLVYPDSHPPQVAYHYRQALESGIKAVS